MTRQGERSSVVRWRRACRVTRLSASRASCWRWRFTLSEYDRISTRRRLAGMVAIVTGAGSRGPGIGNGRAAAVLFAREGARVALVDRVAEWAEQTRAMIADEHGETFVIEADVTRDEDCRRVVEQTVER